MVTEFLQAVFATIDWFGIAGLCIVCVGALCSGDRKMLGLGFVVSAAAVVVGNVGLSLVTP